MKLRLLILLGMFQFGSQAGATGYHYPDDKKPEVSLKQACEIADMLLDKTVGSKGYYALSASVHGDEGQTGAGAWSVYYRNAAGDGVQIAIYFPQDYCLVLAATKKDGEQKPKGFTRDGRVSPKWPEEEERRKEQEAHGKAIGPPPSEETPAKPEPDGGGKPSTPPEPK